MTSNAADNAVVNVCAQKRPAIPELTQMIFPELQKFFKPAFLGRATIVPYFPLNDDEMAQIARLSLRRIEKRVRGHYRASFKYSPQVIELLVQLNQSPETGARAIEQLINRKLMPELANNCIVKMSNAEPINSVFVSVVDNQFVIDIQ
ncbi:hypothetical protein VAE122_3710012 [Vibrio aestuarianus]|nr:hypothetical protein VAE122_3710012 [Vibrio aestuarianus]